MLLAQVRVFLAILFECPRISFTIHCNIFALVVFGLVRGPPINAQEIPAFGLLNLLERSVQYRVLSLSDTYIEHLSRLMLSSVFLTLPSIA